MKKLKSIPRFKNEDEERKFWETHDTTEYIDTNHIVRLVQLRFTEVTPLSLTLIYGRKELHHLTIIRFLLMLLLFQSQNLFETRPSEQIWNEQSMST